MNSQSLMVAIALLALTACQNNTGSNQAAEQPLDSQSLSRLAYEHYTKTEKGLRNSDDTFIPPGTPVVMTGVCELARDVPLFAIDWPGRSEAGIPERQRSFRAHLENNAEVAQMKKGQKYLVKGRIGGGDETMCYGAYFIDVDSFTAID